LCRFQVLGATPDRTFAGGGACVPTTGPEVLAVIGTDTLAVVGEGAPAATEAGVKAAGEAELLAIGAAGVPVFTEVGLSAVGCAGLLAVAAAAKWFDGEPAILPTSEVDGTAGIVGMVAVSTGPVVGYETTTGE
jgi:hypothetical protein